MKEKRAFSRKESSPSQRWAYVRENTASKRYTRTKNKGADEEN